MPVAPFRITVTDRVTGRGIPLVELRTVHEVKYVTDSAGVVAFDEPGLIPGKVFLHVSSPGYELAADGFGYRGVQLDVTPGGSADIVMDRINIAERLYRVTGAGIYRDSVLLGDEPPLPEPVLNGEVLGSDSVQTALYQGHLYWFWGDTNRPSYPLGNFHVPGAISRLPDKGGLPPNQGVALDYLLGDDGFARPLARMPGDGPTWIDGLIVLPDSDGRERMFAAYAKIKPPLTVYERGLAEFNDSTQEFDHAAAFEPTALVFPQGHAFIHPAAPDGYVYFANPYPFVRVRATVEALFDLSRYEAYTCLKPAPTTRPSQSTATTTGPRYSWKSGAPPLTIERQRTLVAAGQLSQDEQLFQLRDCQTDSPVIAHRGSVSWNDYRQRWLMIFTEVGGSSYLGEVWMAEAQSLTGPWTAATRIATHPNYSFYNPKQHALFDQDGGRLIYFEGTYTTTFSGNRSPTPRYDYNQLMYRLDLSDRRLPPQR